MSAEDLRAFFARLEGDAALQERAAALSTASEADRADGLRRLAAELGLDVTADDLAAAAALPGAAALEDEQLKDVAAANGSCSIPGGVAGSSSATGMVPMG